MQMYQSIWLTCVLFALFTHFFVNIVYITTVAPLKFFFVNSRFYFYASEMHKKRSGRSVL